MWWDENTRLYLGQTVVLFQVGRQEVQVMHPSPGRAVDEVLREVGARLPRRARLEVHWGAAYSPLVEIGYPAGMHRWHDRQTFARAVCAQRLGVPAQALAVQFDIRCPRLVAVMLEEHREALLGFGRHRVRRARPLWSIMSESGIVRRANAFCLYEPDSLTLLGRDEQQQLRGLSLPLTADGSAQALVGRLHEDLSIPVRSVASICLHAHAQTAPVRGLDCWHDFWTDNDDTSAG